MSDKSPLDDDWLKVADDWQSQPVKHLDIGPVLKRIKRRIITSKIIMALNVLVTIGFFIGTVWAWFIAELASHYIIYLAFGFVFSVVFVYYEYQLRKSTWQFENKSPEKVLSHALHSCRSSLKYIRLNVIGCWLMVPVSNWFLYEVSSNAGKPVLKGMLMFNLFFVVMFAVLHWCKVKRLKELAHLKTLQSTK